MDIDEANSVAASGLAAGSVGDDAVEDGQSSAAHGDSRPKKRQRREEEEGAGEAVQRLFFLRDCMCMVATSHVNASIVGAWRCTDCAMTAEERC